MNPNDTGYKEPGFHVKDLNNLDVVTEKEISREQIHDYFFWVERKIKRYIEELKDEELLESPEGVSIRDLHLYWRSTDICILIWE
ncbi:MAG: hypothetical protein ACLRMZ_19095 [Blautia marasmi]